MLRRFDFKRALNFLKHKIMLHLFVKFRSKSFRYVSIDRKRQIHEYYNLQTHQIDKSDLTRFNGRSVN